VRPVAGCAILPDPMKLALYHYGSCPYCGIVRQAIDQLGLDVELRNIHETSSRLHELVDGAGRRTVPCLRIESEIGEVRWMPESRDIIRYLQGLETAAS
jgi:glutaredoxin